MRLGIIKISQCLIKEIIEGEGNAFAEFKVFEKITPLQIQEDFLNKVNTYKCYSELFDEVEMGCIIPEYKLTFCKNCKTFKIERLDDKIQDTINVADNLRKTVEKIKLLLDQHFL